jgi:hypothetical protein
LVFFLLAGLGGEGEGGAGFKAVGDRPWRVELLESALLVAVPKRRRMAVAILGQRTGPATLSSWSCSSFFFLLRRIFLCPQATSQAHAPPSGSVPGGSRSGRAWRQLVVNVMLGPDRVFVIYFRVFYVNFLDHVVLFIFCKVISVFVHPPPN